MALKSAPIHGGVTAYEDSGGTGPPVLLAHGFLMNRSMFAAQVEALRDRFRVITWDERGTGDSSDDGLPFDYWDLARDCLDLLDYLGIERAVVGGMSQGGFLALRLALLAPERVRGLILIDSQAGAEEPDRIAIYEALLDEWVATGPTDDMADLVAGLILGEPGLTEVWAERWKTLTPSSMVEPGRALLTRDDVTGRLAEITAPALVIHGTADIAIPMERAEALAAGLPHCTGVVRIPDGTHASNLTHPEDVNEAILSFLDGLGD
jgi:3-oxoadipate enol-lactonase